jgi:hypothetical protein
MKVPTYKSQLQRTDRTGAGMLTAQLDANVMMLPGQALQSFGADLANFGADLAAVNVKKQQLADKNEAAMATQELDTILKNYTLETNKIQNPHEAEEFWKNNLQSAVTEIQSRLSPGALNIFKIDGMKIASDFNFKFREKNDSKIITHTKDMAKNETARKLDIVGDTSVSTSVRLHELFEIIGGKRKDTSNFNFTAIPTANNQGYARGSGFSEQDSNLIMYHRQTITNGTFLENKDGSTTTVFIRGIKNPEEGENSPIYAVPGYYEGRTDWTEEEVIEKAMEEGWFDIYPSDASEAGHKKRVGKLKKIINKDGQTLQKIEKTMQAGINGSLYNNDVIDFNEMTTNNIEALSTAATNTLISLQNNTSDAQDVVLDLVNGNLKDPVLDMIWEQIPLEQQQKIIDKVLSSADRIEALKENEIKEDNQAIEEEYKAVYKAMINTDNYEFALDKLELLIDGRFFESESARKNAEDFVESLRPEATSTVRFRTSEEGSTDEAFDVLSTADALNELSIDMVLERRGDLTQNYFEHFLDRATTERNDALSAANLDFKTIFGYEEYSDKGDRLGKATKAAYQLASNELNNWFNQKENRGATFDEILTKSKSIIKERNQEFILELTLQRAYSVEALSTQITAMTFENKTNAEILNEVKTLRVSNKISKASYLNVLEEFIFYAQKNIDYKP